MSRGSGLDRPGAFRVNVAAGSAEFRRWTGREPRDAAGADVDVRATDVVTAHPVHAGLGWLAVVDPGPRTREALLGLLRSAHDAAAARFRRRVDPGGR